MQRDVFKENAFFAKKEKLLLVGASFLVAFIAYIGVSNQTFLKTTLSLIETPKMSKDWSDFLSYAKEHQDDVFLLSFEKYKELGSIKNPAYKAIEPGSWSNIFSWGYWNIHLPGMKKELRKRGVENPIHDIVHDNVYVVENEGDSFLSAFYPLHYRDSLRIETVRSFGALKLLEYRVAGDSL